MYDLAIRGGTMVTAGGEWPADLGVQDGRIAAVVARGTLGPARESIDASGKHLLPGLVDPHVHLRDPGFTHKEDFHSGTMAAAAGGVTTTMACTNTNPPITTPEAFHLAVRTADEKAVVDFALFAGACMADPAGVAAFRGTGAMAYDIHDDPYRHGTGPWIEMFRLVKDSGLPLCFYVNDDQWRAHNRRELEAARAPAHRAWVGSTPGSLEVACMGRIIPMAARFGVPLVLRSVTTPEGLDFVRSMRRVFPGARIAVESCVHYLFLSEDDLAALGPRAYMGPPLRPAGELPALWQAVADGTVDYLGTDHAPHTREEKAKTADLTRAPAGIIGLETLLPLLLDAQARGRLRLTDVVRLCCESPARTYRIYPRKGTLVVGSDADLVLVDLEERWRIDGSRFYSRGDPGPFDGREVTGRPHLTLVRGRAVMREGVVSPEPWGHLVTPGASD